MRAEQVPRFCGKQDVVGKVDFFFCADAWNDVEFLVYYYINSDLHFPVLKTHSAGIFYRPRQIDKVRFRGVMQQRGQLVFLRTKRGHTYRMFGNAIKTTAMPTETAHKRKRMRNVAYVYVFRSRIVRPKRYTAIRLRPVAFPHNSVRIYFHCASF
jgi:hypothetical protein